MRLRPLSLYFQIKLFIIFIRHISFLLRRVRFIKICLSAAQTMSANAG